MNMYRGGNGLVGTELNMFSHKLEAQLLFQNIPWYWHFKRITNAQEIKPCN